MIEKTINVPKTVWVSDNGVSFDSKEECMAYEKSNENPIETKANLVPHVVTSKDWIDGGAFDSELFTIFYPRDMDDVETIKEWERLRCSCASKEKPETPQPMIYDCYEYECFDTMDDLSKVLEVGSYLGTYDEFKKGFIDSIDAMFEFGEEHANTVSNGEADHDRDWV